MYSSPGSILVYTHKTLNTDARIMRLAQGSYKNTETGEKLTRYELNKTYSFSKKKSSALKVEMKLKPYHEPIRAEHLREFKLRSERIKGRKAWTVSFHNEDLDTFATKTEALSYIREKAST